MIETELEEEKAREDDDSTIDPDIALSYIGEKFQDVLGHFQKDFEDGVSAENLESGKEPAKLVTNTSSYEVAEEEPLGPVAAPTIAAPLVKEDWVCCDKCQAWGFCHLVKFLDIFLRSGFVVCSTGCLE